LRVDFFFADFFVDFFFAIALTPFLPPQSAAPSPKRRIPEPAADT
jgi:hypothetical protein